MTTLTGARVVTPTGVLDPGRVEIRGTTIGAVRPDSPAADPSAAGGEDLTGGWLLPGFIDLHVHGGGGHDVLASPDDLAAAVAYHRSQGTTRTLVSLVTAPVEDLVEGLGWVADLARCGARSSGHVLGAHLEGPFLCGPRRGAQHPDHILAPDPRVLAALLDAGQGWVRTVTLAPEIPGALDLIDQVVGAGAVAAVGHTEATYDQAMAGFSRGARLLTHAYNGMRPPHHRQPGPVPAALDAQIACEVINDGIHVHPAAVRLLARDNADRLILVTDAIAATGIGDGTFSLGGQAVVVRDGQARLTAGGALAGSTLTMAAAVRRAVVEVGLPVPVAAAAASGNPARLLGIADRCGAIVPGLDADLVLLDDAFELRRVMARGQWVT
ncbi:MAG: N-acetylglucosamine-6-phosphate deacetylase [Dactylosporangium sp.]|nr:N-acetylglucosamine-6-phosphate deacetylase [Dactylosporangium sp.]NNJ60282.1 N-acetylglucosamine-6-phosphate deacetylase [Dactylosporangium sp.]